MIREEAEAFLINISYDLGTMGVEYLSVKDGEKMRDAIKALKQESRKDGVILTHKEYNELIANEYNAGYRKGYDNGYCKGCVVASEQQEPVLDKIKEDVKNWYWQADKQKLAEDPCVVDAMIDLFIRTINKYKTESEG